MTQSDNKITEFPFVSVVIIGRNEGERLVKCIKSVQSMDYPADKYEIIYVDSDSQDSSLRKAEELKITRCIHIVPDRPCAAIGRNKGLQEATGEYVLFLDGDTVLNPHFLKKALPCFVDPELAIVFGHRRELKDDSLYIRLCDLDWKRGSGYSNTSAGDILARRDVMNSIKGYNEFLIAGEDPEMSNRIINAGYKIYHIDEDMVLHDLAMYSFRQYWKHAVRSGFAYSIVAHLTKDRDVPLWGKQNLKMALHGFLYIVFPLVSIFLSFYLFSILPILFLFAFFIAVFVRSFIKNLKRISNFKLNIQYVLHSHFQKIPVFIGQLKYLFNKKQRLIEYK